MEWTDMMHYQQQMQKIMRSLLPVRKSALTSSECELLAHLYLKPERSKIHRFYSARTAA